MCRQMEMQTEVGRICVGKWEPVHRFKLAAKLL